MLILKLPNSLNLGRVAEVESFNSTFIRFNVWAS